MKQTIRSAAVIAGFLLAGCATYQMHVSPDEDTASTAGGEVVHKIFLVGDAGEASEAQRDNLALMTDQLKAFGGSATVLYLGDNIYPEGMPPEKDTFPEVVLKDLDKSRPVAEAALMPQIQAVLDAGSDVEGYFVPGNHDWKKGKASGLRQIRRQEKFIEENGEGIVRMLPENGCPGPEVVEIGDDLVLLLIDTQWWLHNWSREKEINEDCDAQSRLDFLAALKDEVGDNKD
ncbi:MAG: metallophosphoesterase, partial [Saprospiraceae bacterium]|nr:metallophosphoesterase [Saprospiraceae bacterium]